MQFLIKLMKFRWKYVNRKNNYDIYFHFRFKIYNTFVKIMIFNRDVGFFYVCRG